VANKTAEAKKYEIKNNDDLWSKCSAVFEAKKKI
jgi:hypothetical protein